MKNAAAATFSTLAFAAGVAAHGGVYFYKLDGVDYEGYHPYNSPDGQSSIQRVWDTHDPILSADSPFTACNTAGTPNQGQQRATVTAGSEVEFTYNKDWDHDTGPISVYLAKCNADSCDNVNVNELDWFKVAASGLLGGNLQNGQWANGKMIEDGWKFKFTLPASIEDGAYLLRSELITLHNLPAQIYPQCAHVDIKGGGGVSVPSEFLVKFPGAYTQADVDVNIWTSSSSDYAIPGPQVYAGSSEAPAPEPTVSSPTAEPQPTSSEEAEPVPTATSTQDEPEPVPIPEPTEQPTATEQPPTTSTTDGAPGATQTKWGQCAGMTWDGPTACAEGTRCDEINEWFSQCVPDDYVEPEDGELWGQCGGRGFRGSRKCPESAECVRVSRWYSECRPLEDSE